MVVKDTEVTKEFESLHCKASKSKNRRYSEHKDAYNKGYKEGKQFSANGRLV